MLLGEMLGRTAARFPDRIAVVCGTDAISFAELDRQACRFANALSSRGITARSLIGILCRNSAEYAIAHFGTARAGCISVHLSTRYAAAELRYTLRKTDCAALVVDPAFIGLYRAVEEALPSKPLLIVTAGTAPAAAVGFADFLAGQPAAAPGHGVGPSDPACINFTSGTTGDPKGAVASHRARVISAEVAAVDFSLSGRDTIAVASPLYHAAGIFTWFQAAVLAGAASVLLPAWDVPTLVDVIARHRVTGAFMVPAQLAMLLGDPSFDRSRLESLRIIVYGGAPAKPELIDRAAAALPWVAFVQNYGQTEMGPLFSMLPSDRAASPAAIGRPNPHIEIALFAEPGRRAAPGEIGEIASRGPHVMSEYYRDPQQTASFFKGGDDWGWTGDLGTMDTQGFITLVGRSKDTIISGGVNIYPAEIERVLLEHDAVRECAAFGIPDDTWGELPAAEVVLQAGSEIGAEALSDFCLSRIARFKRPRLIRIVEALPYSPSGKLDRRQVRERNRGAAVARQA